MNKLGQATKEIHTADHMETTDTRKGGVHPLSRIFVTFCYTLAVMSFYKYDLAGLAGMALYVLVQCIWYEIPFCGMVRRIWPVLLLTGMVGLANPFFDRKVFFSIGNVAITGGMLSMATLMVKGMLCVMASYILVVHTGIRKICCALRLLQVPNEIVTVLLLMHRYLMVLIKEAERMQQAYKLRAPSQRGLHFKTWGSFVGLLLLRSIDRAGEIYESMQLRGFHGVLPEPTPDDSRAVSIVYVLAWGIAILLFRAFPVFRIAGQLVQRILNN